MPQNSGLKQQQPFCIIARRLSGSGIWEGLSWTGRASCLRQPLDCGESSYRGLQHLGADWASFSLYVVPPRGLVWAFLTACAHMEPVFWEKQAEWVEPFMTSPQRSQTCQDSRGRNRDSISSWVECRSHRYIGDIIMIIFVKNNLPHKWWLILPFHI